MLNGLPKNEEDILIAKAIPEELEEVLNNVAATGRLAHPWQEVRLLFRWKLCKVSMNHIIDCSKNDRLFRLYRC